MLGGRGGVPTIGVAAVPTDSRTRAVATVMVEVTGHCWTQEVTTVWMASPVNTVRKRTTHAGTSPWNMRNIVRYQQLLVYSTKELHLLQNSMPLLYGVHVHVCVFR